MCVKYPKAVYSILSLAQILLQLYHAQQVFFKTQIDIIIILWLKEWNFDPIFVKKKKKKFCFFNFFCKHEIFY